MSGPYVVDWEACRQKEREAIARELWAKARELEERGNAATTGIAKMDEAERARAMSKQGGLFGGSEALEQAAWRVLGRSGEAINSDFFK